MSEQPEATPADPSPGQPERPSRYNRSFGGLLGSMIVIVVLVSAYVGIRALVRDQPDIEPESVDYLASVAQLQGAGDTVLYPVALPAGWTATSVDFEPGRPPSWRIGFLTDRGRFVGMVQERQDLDELLSTYVDKSPTQGEDAAPDNGLGVSDWQTWSDPGGDHAFSTELGSGPLAGETVLVYGSAPLQDQEALIGLLTLDPVATPSGSPSG